MKVPRYLEPNSTQTLREAIAELRALEGADDAAESIAPELLPDIEIHDVIHVLFGCRTDLADEVMAHIWTVFGTTYPVGDMARVNAHQDHRSVLAGIGHVRLLKMWICRIPAIVKTLYRAQRMKKRFPAQDYIQYLDKRLVDIRAEFGIRLTVSSAGQLGKRAGAALRTLHQADEGQPALSKVN